MLAGWGRPRCPQCHVSTGVPGGRYRDGPQRLVGGDIVTAWPILQALANRSSQPAPPLRQIIRIKRFPAGFIIPPQPLMLQDRPPAPIGFTKSSMTGCHLTQIRRNDYSPSAARAKNGIDCQPSLHGNKTLLDLYALQRTICRRLAERLLPDMELSGPSSGCG
jgi:hypothetical protein